MMELDWNYSFAVGVGIEAVGWCGPDPCGLGVGF